MNNQRNLSFDFTRSLAIIIIVTCHFFMFEAIKGSYPLGRHLAGIGNNIFFALSAFLFGLRYEAKGAAAFAPASFMKKRIIRLFASLWPFLTVMTIVYFISNIPFSISGLAMNYAGLCWFAKLPNMGHLWFVTEIIFCYIMYVVCTASSILIKTLTKLNGGGYLLLVILSLIAECVFDRIGLPGSAITIMVYSLVIFMNASHIMRFVAKINGLYVFPLLIVANVTSYYLCIHEQEYGFFVRDLAGYFSSFLWLIYIIKCGNRLQSLSTPLKFLSIYGFEMYLIHHVFCQGELSVLHISEYTVINYFILWAVTIPLAWLLSKISNKINSIFYA